MKMIEIMEKIAVLARKWGGFHEIDLIYQVFMESRKSMKT